MINIERLAYLKRRQALIDEMLKKSSYWLTQEEIEALHEDAEISSELADIFRVWEKTYWTPEANSKDPEEIRACLDAYRKWQEEKLKSLTKKE